MKITVREMTIKDLKLIKDELHRTAFGEILERRLGPAVVIEDEQGPLCLGAGVILWPGVAEICFIPLHLRHLRSLIRRLRWLLERGAKRYGIRRLQAFIESGFEKGCRFAECMGFEKEAVLKLHHYTGKDSIIYARLF